MAVHQERPANASLCSQELCCPSSSSLVLHIACMTAVIIPMLYDKKGGHLLSQGPLCRHTGLPVLYRWIY